MNSEAPQPFLALPTSKVSQNSCLECIYRCRTRPKSIQNQIGRAPVYKINDISRLPGLSWRFASTLHAFTPKIPEFSPTPVPSVHIRSAGVPWFRQLAPFLCQTCTSPQCFSSNFQSLRHLAETCYFCILYFIQSSCNDSQVVII